MEDCNALMSDCVVISCCCQCLILQLIIFIFVQLPRKAACKAKAYAKKKLAHRRKAKGKKYADHHQHRGKPTEFDAGRSLSMRILELEGIALNKLHNWGDCTDEVEKVLEELSVKGEFAFGSFWGRNPEERGGFRCNCSRSMTKQEVLEYGSHVVQFHLIEVVGPFNSS